MTVEFLATTTGIADNGASSMTVAAPPGGSNDFIMVFAQVVSNTVTLNASLTDDSPDTITWTLGPEQASTSPTPDTDRHFWTSDQITDPGEIDITVSFSGSIDTGSAERGFVRVVRFTGVSSSPFGNSQYTYNGSMDSTHTNSSGWTVGSGNLGVHMVVQRPLNGISYTPDTGWTEIWEDTGTTGGDLREPASTMNIKTGTGASEQPTTTSSVSWFDNSVWGFELVADTANTIQVIDANSETVNLSDGGAGYDHTFDPNDRAQVGDVLAVAWAGVNSNSNDAVVTANGTSTVATEIVDGSSDTGLVIARHTLTASDITDGTVNIARPAPNDLQRGAIISWILRFPNGFGSATPEDATPNPTSGSSHTAQGYNTTPAAAVGDLLVAHYSTDPISPGETWTKPTGWSVLGALETNLRPHALAVVKPVTSAGAQSDEVAELSGSGSGGQTTMILFVDSGGGGSPNLAGSASTVTPSATDAQLALVADSSTVSTTASDANLAVAADSSAVTVTGSDGVIAVPSVTGSASTVAVSGSSARLALVADPSTTAVTAADGHLALVGGDATVTPAATNGVINPANSLAGTPSSVTPTGSGAHLALVGAASSVATAASDGYLDGNTPGSGDAGGRRRRPWWFVNRNSQ